MDMYFEMEGVIVHEKCKTMSQTVNEYLKVKLNLM